MMRYVRLLSVAGSDSGGGAGIQADLKTFAALGAYGMSVITAVTAQNTRGVSAIHSVPPEIVVAQLEAVLSDIGTDALKTGMLAHAETVSAVAGLLRQYQVARVVVDPVMVATSGDTLLDDDAVEVMKQELFPRADVLTPNLPEAVRILGHPISGALQARDAAVELLQFGCRAVLVKGGHLNDTGRSDDVLAMRVGNGAEVLTIPGARIDTRNTHGTGCTLSSAIAVFLGRGLSIPEAVIEAKRYLSAALAAGAAFTLGHGHGPVCHGYEPVSTLVQE